MAHGVDKTWTKSSNPGNRYEEINPEEGLPPEQCINFERLVGFSIILETSKRVHMISFGSIHVKPSLLGFWRSNARLTSWGQSEF